MNTPYPPPQKPRQRRPDSRATAQQQQIVPTNVIMALMHLTKTHYDEIAAMLQQRDQGFRRLSFECDQITRRLQITPPQLDEQGQPYPVITLPTGQRIDARLYRLHVSLQASLRMHALGKAHLEQQLEVDRQVHGELDRFLHGQPPMDFVGPQVQQVQQGQAPGGGGGEAPSSFQFAPPQQPAQLMPPQQAYPQFAPQQQQQPMMAQQPQQQQQPFPPHVVAAPQQQPQMMVPPPPQFMAQQPGYFVPVPEGQTPQVQMGPMPPMMVPVQPQMQQQQQQVMPPQYAPQPHPQIGQHIFGAMPPQQPGAPQMMMVDPARVDPRHAGEVLGGADHMPSMQLPVAQVPFDSASIHGPPPLGVPQYTSPEAARAAMLPNAPPPPIVTAPVVQYGPEGPPPHPAAPPAPASGTNVNGAGKPTAP